MNEVGFLLYKITTKQFAMLPDNLVNKSEVLLESQLRFSLDKKRKTLAVLPSFQFKDNKIPFLLIELNCEFKVADYLWNNFVQKNTKEFIIPRDFILHLAVLSVGTARGVLHARTENTSLNTYLLPTINVEKMLPDDLRF